MGFDTVALLVEIEELKKQLEGARRKAIQEVLTQWDCCNNLKHWSEWESYIDGLKKELRKEKELSKK